MLFSTLLLSTFLAGFSFAAPVNAALHQVDTASLRARGPDARIHARASGASPSPSATRAVSSLPLTKYSTCAAPMEGYTLDYQRIDRAFHEHGADIVCLYGNAAGAKTTCTYSGMDGALEKEDSSVSDHNNRRQRRDSDPADQNDGEDSQNDDDSDSSDDAMMCARQLEISSQGEGMPNACAVNCPRRAEGKHLAEATVTSADGWVHTECAYSMERDGEVAFNCKYNGLTGEMLEAESDSCPAMAVKSHYCINYLTMA